MKSKCFFCQGFPLKFCYIAIIITDMQNFRMEKYKKYLPNLILQADHDFPLHRSPICFGIPEKSLLPPFSLKPWELSLHDTNSHLGNCPRPSPKGLHKRTGHKCHRMDGCSKVSIWKPRSRDHGHIGTLPHPRRLSPSQYERFVWQSIELSWVTTSMALYHFHIALWNDADDAIIGCL